MNARDEHELDAALDGELDPERSLALQRRLAHDPALRVRWERRVALRDALRAHGRRHEAPPALEAAIRRAVAASAAEPAAPSVPQSVSVPEPVRPPLPRIEPRAGADDAGTRRPEEGGAGRRTVAWQRPARRDRRMWIAAAGSALASSLLTIAALRVVPAWREGAGGPAPDPLVALADDAVAGHVRAFLADRVVEVESTSQHTVRPWLSTHLPFAPPVADLSAHGFELVGARRDLAGAQTVAALVYKRHLHMISVFVRPEAGADRAPVVRAIRGYNAIAFVHAGMAWCLVSDLEARELAELADLLRAA